MKVLFAVSNDNVSNSIIKKYQQKYKEIITSKNVYYFNAIIKELQKDKSYDAVVIGEDLEPISNNNYDTVDKFIFDKLDSISDEAYKNTGEDIPIILICSDRRTKSDALLVKLFGIGIYNALLGNDRNIETVCNLINKPRSKKEAKIYYKIDSEDVNYRPESEVEVSETEIQNILAHYKKIGNNEKKCVESFDSIASQYTDTQLRIIIKFLPANVKAILERNSAKYIQLVNGGTVLSNGQYKPYEVSNKKNNKKNMDLLTKDLEKTKLSQPVIIPSTMNIEAASSEMRNPTPVNEPVNNMGQINQVYSPYQMPNQMAGHMSSPEMMGQPMNNMVNNEPVAPVSQNINSTPYMQGQTEINPFALDNAVQNNNETIEVEPEKPKRRGRPKKITQEEAENPVVNQTVQPAKRGRGRPKKNVAAQTVNVQPEQTVEMQVEQPVEAQAEKPVEIKSEKPTVVPENSMAKTADDTINLFDLGANATPAPEPEIKENVAPINNVVQNNNATQTNNVVPENNMADNSSDINLFGMADDVLQPTNPYEVNNNNFYSPYMNENPMMNQGIEETNPFEEQDLVNQNFKNNVVQNSNFIAQNSKIVAFVGTSKNGTSFIVNNLAEFLSQKGIKTAILDLTKNKNSYYMFTNNDQNLMKSAENSVKNLIRGSAEGVPVNKNLTVFTTLPGEDGDLSNVDSILQTLDNNYSAVLMDCDFDTNINYFVKATEIYLVQSMDALTIQPLTLFLSELKLKNVLDENKLRVIINKNMKLKILTDKMILIGMSKYNEPSMTLQRDLFNPNTIKYATIPFEEQTYARYLEAIALCQVSLSGYSQRFLSSLEELATMVYPLIQGSASSSYSGYSKYSPDYEKAKRGGLFGKNKKQQQQTQFSAGVNGTLNKMRSNY